MKFAGWITSRLKKLPLAADLSWYLRNPGRKAFSRFNLELLNECLPEFVAQVTPFSQSAPKGRQVVLFASFHPWIIHTTLCGLVLRGMGHDACLITLPYGDYNKPVSAYDLRRQDLYARHVLRKALPVLPAVSLLTVTPSKKLPPALAEAVERVTRLDAQYVLQREELRGDEPITRLRRERNFSAANRAYAWFQKQRPDVVVIPNGMIQEYAAVYETARHLGIQAVTYEFGEHHQRTWLGHDRLVIHHVTDELWASRRNRVLDASQRQWLEQFLAGRKSTTAGSDFAHLWQKADSEGGARVRDLLGLDKRPVVLLPTNVLGDSATLGLELFSGSMTEWLQRVVKFLANRPQVQVVVRIHPAETWTVGLSVEQIISEVLPDLPEHIHLVRPKEKINTYDLMELTDLALVYTTTAGLEMATRGIPVLVSGKAHFRGKGFTLEADTWEGYFKLLEQTLVDLPGHRLTAEQVERAWNYAYCFFAEYPLPFPWHLEKIKTDLKEWPLDRVLSPEGMVRFKTTFQEMAGIRVER